MRKYFKYTIITVLCMLLLAVAGQAHGPTPIPERSAAAKKYQPIPVSQLQLIFLVVSSVGPMII